MNITADLIKSILTQAEEAITCKNLRTEDTEDEDIIIRFEDDTDHTISIYYTPAEDLLAIGTIDRTGNYRSRTRYKYPSRLDPDILVEHITLAVTYIVLALELAHDTEEV